MPHADDEPFLLFPYPDDAEPDGRWPFTPPDDLEECHALLRSMWDMLHRCGLAVHLAAFRAAPRSQAVRTSEALRAFMKLHTTERTDPDD